MSNNRKTILVIAPHQDDETIGCGGTIVALVERGYDVRVVHVFAGTSGVHGAAPERSRETRHCEAKNAAHLGGYTLLPNLGFIDRDHSTDKTLQGALIRTIRQEKPVAIFVPHKQETDYEHRLVAVEAREALWLAATDIFPELGESIGIAPRVFYYEVWKNIDAPTVLNDITKYIDKKRAMLAAFASQMEHSGWIEGSIGRNAYRGVTTVGNGYYEVFETEGIPLKELLS